jgi:hypothetical protein
MRVQYHELLFVLHGMMPSTRCEDGCRYCHRPKHSTSEYKVKFDQSARQPALNQQGTLAEWLTRGPAKLISSEACVRITQVSVHLFFCFLGGRTTKRFELGKIRNPMQQTATTSQNQPTACYATERTSIPSSHRSVLPHCFTYPLHQYSIAQPRQTIQVRTITITQTSPQCISKLKPDSVTAVRRSIKKRSNLRLPHRAETLLHARPTSRANQPTSPPISTEAPPTQNPRGAASSQNLVSSIMQHRRAPARLSANHD